MMKIDYDTLLYTPEHRADTAPTTMKAAVLTGAGRMRVDEVDVPIPGNAEVRVRLAGCGVCSSNLGPWAGPDWMQFPTDPGALGHEGWGTVDAVGDGVDTVKPGDRVAALFYNSYAEYDVGLAENVVKLPPELAQSAFPGEPLGCAMNIFRRSDMRPGQTVAIVGIGFLGALLTALAVRHGANVIAISRRDCALRQAERAGAFETIALADPDAAVRRVGELTDGRLCDRVIEATGKQGPLDLAGRLAMVRGKLIIGGYHQDGPRRIDMQQWNWRGLDVINAHERDPAAYMQGMRDAVAAVAAGEIDIQPLLTHSYPLEELGRALDDTRDRPDGFLKAIICMS